MTTYRASLGTRGELRRIAAEAETATIERVRPWSRKRQPCRLAPHVIVPQWTRSELPPKPPTPPPPTVSAAQIAADIIRDVFEEACTAVSSFGHVIRSEKLGARNGRVKAGETRYEQQLMSSSDGRSRVELVTPPATSGPTDSSDPLSSATLVEPSATAPLPATGPTTAPETPTASTALMAPTVAVSSGAAVPAATPEATVDNVVQTTCAQPGDVVNAEPHRGVSGPSEIVEQLVAEASQPTPNVAATLTASAADGQKDITASVAVESNLSGAEDTTAPSGPDGMDVDTMAAEPALVEEGEIGTDEGSAGAILFEDAENGDDVATGKADDGGFGGSGIAGNLSGAAGGALPS